MESVPTNATNGQTWGDRLQGSEDSDPYPLRTHRTGKNTPNSVIACPEMLIAACRARVACLRGSATDRPEVGVRARGKARCAGPPVATTRVASTSRGGGERWRWCVQERADDIIDHVRGQSVGPLVDDSPPLPEMPWRGGDDAMVRAGAGIGTDAVVATPGVDRSFAPQPADHTIAANHGEESMD